MRFTTKPGALLQGSGSLSSLRVNCSASCTTCACVLGALHDFHQLQLRHGIEEMNADQAAGIRAASRLKVSILMLEVLVARMALGFELGFELRVQRPLGVDVLEDGFDDDVGIAPRRRRSRPSAGARTPRPPPAGSLRRLSKKALARSMAGSNQFLAAILQRDRHAAKRRPGRDIAAHDAGADDVHVLENRPCDLPPKPLSRSCSRNTRTRLREVGVHMSSLIERASAS